MSKKYNPSRVFHASKTHGTYVRPENQRKYGRIAVRKGLGFVWEKDRESIEEKLQRASEAWTKLIEEDSIPLLAARRGMDAR